MDVEYFRGRCTAAKCRLADVGSTHAPHIGDDLLSVVVLYDHPYNSVALDEALFGLAVQDHENLEVVLVLPECGQAFCGAAERLVVAQPWPAQARAQIVSVSAQASKTISADLLNAGLLYSAGRYVAFLHHQDLVYQHAYLALIERLRSTEAVAAFGGVRVATHREAHRHWMVASKGMLKADAPRIGVALNGRAAVHSFVMDRTRLASEHLLIHNPQARLAVTMFLMGLALHPKADFALAGNKMVESRTPPDLSAAGIAGLGRLPSAETVAASLAGAGFRLRPDAVNAGALLAEAIRALNSAAA